MTLTRRAAVLAALVLVSLRGAAADPVVFITAFAAGDKGGVHAYTFDPKAGTLKPLARTGGVENPFFLALSPDRKVLYATSAKEFSGKEHEHVTAFRVVDRTGEMKLLNRRSSEGTATCYLEVDRTGKALLAANYTTGSVASFPLAADGTIGERVSFHQHTGSSVNGQRQAAAHAHCIVVSPDNRYAYAADLGADKIFCYALDAAAAKLTANAVPFAKAPAGAGPRHLTFHPNGKRVYVLNELVGSITAFDYDAATGALTEKQTISTLPADFKGASLSADVKVTPDGRFLYATNRGHDSVAAFRVGDDGKLELIAIEPSRGKGPQNLAITPDGRWLLCANMPGNSVAVFAIDATTGRLKAAGEPLAQPGPSCIMLLP